MAHEEGRETWEWRRGEEMEGACVRAEERAHLLRSGGTETSTDGTTVRSWRDLASLFHTGPQKDNHDHPSFALQSTNRVKCKPSSKRARMHRRNVHDIEKEEDG